MLELAIAVIAGITIVWHLETVARLNRLARDKAFAEFELHRLLAEIEAAEKLLYHRLDASDGYHEYLPLPELVKMVLNGEDEPVFKERQP